MLLRSRQPSAIAIRASAVMLHIKPPRTRTEYVIDTLDVIALVAVATIIALHALA
jgi:hypothetical protein